MNKKRYKFSAKINRRCSKTGFSERGDPRKNKASASVATPHRPARRRAHSTLTFSVIFSFTSSPAARRGPCRSFTAGIHVCP